MEFKTFSCYDNFVPGNNCGAPEHTPTHYALQHLERLLQTTSQRVRQLSTQQLAIGRSPPPLAAQPEEKNEDGSEAGSSKGMLVFRAVNIFFFSFFGQ
jgi:hypothetical protein